MMVDYVREMTVKKPCKYDEYGSFEHMLFLFVLFLFFCRGIKIIVYYIIIIIFVIIIVIMIFLSP